MKLYDKIYKDLKSQIADGIYDNGKLLPTEISLQNAYGVSRITVKHAYEKLVSEGLVVRAPGRGTLLAEHVKKRGNKMIGLVLCDFNQSFGLELVKSIERYAAENGYSVVLKISRDDHETERRVLSELTALDVSGIIIQNCHGEFTKNLIELSIKGFPLVSIDRYAKGLLIPSVTSDNFNASFKATEYFLKQGNKKILFASASPQNTSTLTERFEGFRQAYVDNGVLLSADNFITDLKSPVEYTDENKEQDTEKIANALRENNITSVIAAESGAGALCAAAAEKAGKHFSEDFEMICFDKSSKMPQHKNITSILQNEQEMGKAAVNQLMHIIHNESFDMRTVIDTRFFSAI